MTQLDHRIENGNVRVAELRLESCSYGKAEYVNPQEPRHSEETTRIQFQALIIDYITILVPVSLKLRNNRFYSINNRL